MDPVTKWFLLLWCALVVIAGCFWIWQECGWWSRMDKLFRGDKK